MGFCSPLFAKLWAVKFALEWCLSNGYEKVMVESDSLLAVNIVQDTSIWKGSQQALIISVNLMINQFSQFSIIDCIREINKPAHWLARRGLSLCNEQLFYVVIPDRLLSLLYRDLYGVPRFHLINKISKPTTSL